MLNRPGLDFYNFTVFFLGNKRSAVKVINHYGDEVLQVSEV
jgi:hypothetical protein